MFADVVPSPTYYSDWHMVGWPASLIVPCALAASLIALFVVVARRARLRWAILTLVLCVLVFVDADYAAYEFGYRNQHLWRTPTRRPNILETPLVEPKN